MEEVKIDKNLGCTIKEGDIIVTGKDCEDAFKAFKKIKEMGK